jgi:ubiquinone/menaquinone biosynthesis C-methylase UbiE
MDINEWHKFFEEKASGPKGDTISALEYNTSLQNHYITSAFRCICSDLPHEAIVLDAGCGNGLFWKKFLAPKPAVGVDYSPQMCELAQAKGMTAYQADILKLPFADEQFDLVYCAEIIQYIDDLASLLTEFTRVCRSGGRIVVSTINRTSLLQRSARWIRSNFPREDMPLSFRYFTRTADEIVNSARGLSIVVNTVAWTHFPFPWLRQSKSPERAMDWLAWNVYVEFRKPPS